MVASNLKLVYSATVDFDADLSHHGITKGVLTNPAEHEIFAPVAMWLEALDLVLTRLQKDGLDFGRVKGVSGAGMQHGTVFWGPKAEEVLGHMDGSKGLAEQLVGRDESGNWKDGADHGVFAHGNSPNWQDASTQKQCEEFDKCLGSPEKLAEVTGSKAHHVSLKTMGFWSAANGLNSDSAVLRLCGFARNIQKSTPEPRGYHWSHLS